jgi:hypothetical protein
MSTHKKATCPQCGKRFQPWRAKRYCSEPCRKKAENGRLRAVRGDEATPIAADPNQVILPKQKQELTRPLRGHEEFEWTACNEVTRKLTRAGSPNAVGWAMLVDGHGWFGRVSGEREYSFGASTMARAKSAVEAHLLGEPFDKAEGSGHAPGRVGGCCPGMNKAPPGNLAGACRPHRRLAPSSLTVKIPATIPP